MLCEGGVGHSTPSSASLQSLSYLDSPQRANIPPLRPDIRALLTVHAPGGGAESKVREGGTSQDVRGGAVFLESYFQVSGIATG